MRASLCAKVTETATSVEITVEGELDSVLRLHVSIGHRSGCPSTVVKGGVRALRAPLNTLHANWAYMAIVAIAWSLKAWFALSIPVAPRWRTQHEADRERVLRMEFRSFVQRFILVPAQIVRTGRQLIYRLLAWRPELPIFFRLLDAL
jgi:hypothetical protein